LDSADPADLQQASLATSILPERAKSIITRNASPDIVFEQSINPYRGCEHGCIYCLSGDTPILLASGATRSLADLVVGDEIIGTQKRGHYRRYVRTRVLAHWRTRKPAFRITLADGTELIASGDHRFLTERGWKFVAQGPDAAQRPRLTLNNTLMGFGALPRAPSAQGNAAYRSGYLCGVIRGDGHLGVYRYQRVGRRHGDQHRFRLALTDLEPLQRSAEFLGGLGIRTDRFTFAEARESRQRMEALRTSSQASVAAIHRIINWPDQPDDHWRRGFLAGIFDAEGSFSDGCLRIANTDDRLIRETTAALRHFSFESVVETTYPADRKPVHYVRLRGGLREHLRFFGACDPAIRRKRDFTETAVKCNARLEVVGIEPLDRDLDLFDITTGTGDFIANGVISHNCYARPSHAYVGLSPGLDFESKIFFKADAARLLEAELAKPGYVCKPIMLGANTDPYQPAERQLRVTRSLLEVLAQRRHPVGLITKGALIERDLDLLQDLARDGLTRVMISLPTLDAPLKRILEPRAASIPARLRVMRQLADAGVPVGVFVAPVIPVLTDHEIERVLQAAAGVGATRAAYILLRLPYEVGPLFREWLAAHFPDSARHVMARVQDLRGGRDNDPCFGTRMSGQGAFAALVKQRFSVACRRLGLATDRNFELETRHFRPATPVAAQEQLPLAF
jgi:DNA repair photolyase